ncbi:hypothetical protein LAZ67_12002261 [Cordylochernes scorpioides]|uniref:Reversion-inducing cysteine-rich protein with Kazal frizzled-like domain-containing protein n=1 Tax=Cordylochernes scorpioides TaxID=51811 RepID=A0ABY6L1M9_9ARAC|nr:hypothetical protein LAZ67_12002261 [Cordylochernes scorpioides]
MSLLLIRASHVQQTSDCIKVLSECVNRSKLPEGHTPRTLCEMLSLPGDTNDCISLDSYLHIAHRLKINARIVRRIVKQYREQGHYGVLPKSDRPRTVNTSATGKIMKKRISRNDGVSMNQITSDLGISRERVQNIVKRDLGLRSYHL